MRWHHAGAIFGAFFVFTMAEMSVRNRQLTIPFYGTLG